MPTSTSSSSAPSSSRPSRPSLLPIATSKASAILSADTSSPVSTVPTVSSTPTDIGKDIAAASSSCAGAGSARDNIEMEPIVTGHRRRKSSLMGGTAGLSPVIAGRPRSQSLRTPQFPRSPVASSSLVEEPKIAEEGDLVNSPAPRNFANDSDSYSDDVRDDEETGLTRQEKRRQQKKRKRNTLLDQRIAKEKESSTAPEGADQGIVMRIAINVGLILLWYFFSLCISLYNKWMFDEDRLNFAFPLFTTSMHMVVQFCLAGAVLYFVPSTRPGKSHSSDSGRSRHEDEPASNSGNSIMSKMFYFTRIGPCGAATGLDIGLGNTSLKFISLTFYTMCKSSSLAFVLCFAFLFRLETPTWRLVAIIAVMTVGVVLMVFGEVQFHVGGFVLVISAAFFSGFRWGLTQILLLRHPATSNPFSSIFLLTPVMFLTLLSLAIPVEGFTPLFGGLAELSKEFGVFLTPCFLLFPGCIAFLMTAAEFALLQRTSVVTLSIAGIFKEVVTIMAASVVFHEKLTAVNFVGLVTTLIAIMAYNYIKISKMRGEARTGKAPARYQRASASDHSSASEFEDDDTLEETSGLLRPNGDMGHDALITTDGDIHPNVLGISTHDESKESAMNRHDD
ncbi:solute carrier family 35 member C2 [Emericellopsis atlantica]|uniref:Solute carrier family 35 member C2 n=1 Tax=Emericellopsis atlantica TaxID=2614577 RepID=A0A9P7ZRL4_9HYPO|nr:solute carrier family 35 member C2 [Emericellopsis atlantica]KAG9257048.1 solute carrier family 35 member C2 [Emericellopsis atlantica]